MGVSNHLNRSWTKRAAAATAVVGAAFYGLAFGGAAQASVPVMTITAVAPHHVAALTAKQLITVTGTNFDESLISNVKIDACTNDPMYIVQNSTTLLLKTDASCAANNLAKVTIVPVSGSNVVTAPVAGGKTELDFVTAPTLATNSDTTRPVYADNSAGADYGKQAHSGSISGGTVVRVNAGTGTTFATSAAYPLAATLDGVAMTKITVVGSSAGNYFTAVLGPDTAENAAPTLKITNNGVSASFAFDGNGATAAANTHDFAYSGTSITVAPASGPIMGTNKITITGAGFTSSTTVTVGGNTCTGPVATATKVTCTVPAATGQAAGPAKVVVTTGTVVSVLGAGSIYTYLDQ